MVVDKINFVLNDTVITTKKPVEISYREILFPYSKNHFFEQLGINIIFGNKVDLKSEQLFLPSELYNNIKDLKVDNQPICKESNKILEVEKTKIPFSWWNNLYAFCLIFVIIIFLNKSFIYKSYFLFLGTLGLFFIFAGFYSLHKELVNNYNILLFNPGLFAIVLFEIKNNKKWILYSSIFCIICLLIYIAILINKPYLGIVAPFIITSGVRLIQLFLKNRR